jgi:solute carrier family 25 2-oxodicarboxylate transporter 21
MSEKKADTKSAHGHGHGHNALPFHKQVIAGGSAGVCEILIMYPTDVIKTRAQLSKNSLSMIGAAKSIMKNEGFGTFYRGIVSPILAEAPKRAVKFSANEQYKVMLKNDKGELPWNRAFAAGALAGTTEMFINCPFEVVKVRMQAKENRGLYTSTLDCAKKLVNQEGFMGLYKGGEPQLWRNAVWNGIYFGIIGTVRQMMPVPAGASKGQKMFTDFLTGAVGGGIATTFNTPFDVVKSRMQNQLPGQARKYNWSWPSLATIYREEGLRALFKGYGPRMVRLGPGGGIMLVAFDKVSEWIR